MVENPFGPGWQMDCQIRVTWVTARWWHPPLVAVWYEEAAVHAYPAGPSTEEWHPDSYSPTGWRKHFFRTDGIVHDVLFGDLSEIHYVRYDLVPASAAFSPTSLAPGSGSYAPATPPSTGTTAGIQNPYHTTAMYCTVRAFTAGVQSGVPFFQDHGQFLIVIRHHWLYTYAHGGPTWGMECRTPDGWLRNYFWYVPEDPSTFGDTVFELVSIDWFEPDSGPQNEDPPES